MNASPDGGNAYSSSSGLAGEALSHMASHISTRITQFDYFDQALEGPVCPVWRDSKILDFGGNVGGFLAGADSSVDHDDYWCVDLHHAAIEEGRRNFPHAHFVHYNRYSSEYNPNGVRYLPIPDCGLKFDIILAFSVFTHVHQSEMLELAGQLRSMLAPSGVLAFTFIDPSYDKSLSDPSLPSGSDVRKRLESRRVGSLSRDIDDKVARASRSNWCVLIDDELHVEPGENFSHQQRIGKAGESYITYYKAEYMASLFPRAKVLPPVSPEWQHCCVLQETD